MFEEHIGRLRLLNSARLRVAEDSAQWKEMQDAFRAEHADFLEGKGIAAEVLNRIEADVREEALVLYRMTPNTKKTGIPGITIRETREVGFDPDVAKQWALDHKAALKLDEAAYKKMVLAEEAPGKIETTLTAAIAADLSAFAI